MNYHIAICDDNDTDLKYVEALVSRWAQNSHHTVNISTFSSAEAFLFHYVEDKSYDILLLDIEMGSIDGVELAKRIRVDNEAVQIVFITGFTDYIAEGYEVAALHYIVKPVKEEKFFQILDRAVQKIQKNEQALLLELSNETVRIPVYEIRYLEVQQNYVTIHAKSDYTIKKTLSEFEHQLDEGFYRMGRSYLVNLSYISKITKTEVFLSEGSVIGLPRGQYEPLNRAFICHI
jgi:DNA-binding LytR/AlgR family response regulator